MYLERIQSENDIKKIPEDKLNALADEIRQFLIEKISVTGGHLGSNLGAVELTMALHLSLDLPKDKIIWDVGHQSYTHKLLTGRREGFDTLRKFGGMAGFPKRIESDCDCFNTGHSSTSISAGLGLVKARDLRGENHTIVSVIGDGSLTGGMAYEALNNASKLETNFIIVLNDNNMSISENVGGVSKYLNGIRTADSYLDLKESIFTKLMNIPGGANVVKTIRKTKSTLKSMVIPGMFFEDMGITYLGPVNGHDINAVRELLKDAKRKKGPVLVHVITQKGKGYTPAERHPARFHGTEPFIIETGLPSHPRTKANYTDVFSTIMMKLADRHPEVVAITAAMADGTGLKRFRNVYPERFFDVGIAEEHAVTFAAGLAVGGLKPIVCIYSSFLQRAYDQILHDVCIQNLPVVFAIDRAGVVGSDGETHQGIFDVSYLSSIPGFAVMAPKNAYEFADMLVFACSYNGPSAIRYPRAKAFYGCKTDNPIVLGKAEVLHQGKKAAVIAVGKMVKVLDGILTELRDEGYDITFVNARFINPIDFKLIDHLCDTHELIITAEENVKRGGFGEAVALHMLENRKTNRFLNISLPDSFLPHGNPRDIRDSIGFDPKSLKNKIKKSIDEI